MNALRPFLVVGTRPEAIKMAPVVRELQLRAPAADPLVCLTGQHREMLKQVTDHFQIRADLNLDLMRPNQSLAGLTARCLEALDEALVKFAPDCVVAQGDTTTVMTAALAAFYRRIPFVHVEAGLRTGNLQSPWPEELNRRVAGLMTTLHCAPTQRAAKHLLAEGTDPRTVHVTGNTVIDALLWTVARQQHEPDRWQRFAMLGDRPLVLVTGHRRENFGEGFQNICSAIATLASRYGDVEFLYPVHLNPNVRGPVHATLGNRRNVKLIEPASYPEFVWLMNRSTIILTDSGGVQEEAPSLGKPVLVMRDTTERPEAVDAGAVQLVGTSVEAIVETVSLLLDDPAEHARRRIDTNPYGDGHAAERIVDLMLRQGWQQRRGGEVPRAA